MTPSGGSSVTTGRHRRRVGRRKSRSIQGKEWLENTRRGWARAANRALEARAGPSGSTTAPGGAVRRGPRARGTGSGAGAHPHPWHPPGPGAILGRARRPFARRRDGRGNRAEKPRGSSGTGRTQEPGRVRGSGGPGSGAANTGVGLRNQFGAAAGSMGEDSNAAGERA